jgi:hypothetical protein
MTCYAKGTTELNSFNGNKLEKVTASHNGDALTVDFGDLEVYGHWTKQVKKNGAQLREAARLHFRRFCKKLTIPFKGGIKLTIQGAGSLF